MRTSTANSRRCSPSSAIPESLEIAAAFWDMSNEERGHGTALQKGYFERYGTQACAVTEEDISDFIEAPRLEAGRIFNVSAVKDNRSPREMALEVAAAAEASAIRFYRGLARTCQDPELRALYQEFVNFEANHSGWSRSSATCALPPTELEAE